MSSCPHSGITTFSYTIPAFSRSCARPWMIRGRVCETASRAPVSYSPRQRCTAVPARFNFACVISIPKTSNVSPQPTGQGSESIRVRVPGEPIAIARTLSGCNHQNRYAACCQLPRRVQTNAYSLVHPPNNPASRICSFRNNPIRARRSRSYRV